MLWEQRAELTGQALPPARAAGRVLLGPVVDLDAFIVVCHREKEQAAPTFKTFGFRPMPAFCDDTAADRINRLGPGDGIANLRPSSATRCEFPTVKNLDHPRTSR